MVRIIPLDHELILPG